MYKIGDFSKITQLSVKTLRYYDEINILSPSMRDETTHYRYYKEADFQRAEMIKLLRAWTFSIQEIKDILDTMQEPTDLRYYLEEKQATLRKEIMEKETLIQQMEDLLHHQKDAIVENPYEIEQIEISELMVAAYAYCGTYQEMAQYLALMYKEIKGNGSKDAPFNCYFDTSYEEKAHIEICIPIKKTFTCKYCHIKTLPAIKGIATTHYGSYQRLNMAYKAVIDYANAHQLSLCVPSREIYRRGPGKIFKGNPNTYVTQIVIPYQEKDDAVSEK